MNSRFMDCLSEEIVQKIAFLFLFYSGNYTCFTYDNVKRYISITDIRK